MGEAAAGKGAGVEQEGGARVRDFDARSLCDSLEQTEEGDLVRGQAR